MAAYRCPGCDYIYDEAKGAAREGFPAGTRWEQIPADWSCPDCAVLEKIDFELRPTTMRAGTAREGAGQSREVNQ
jgi:rubredoxin